jgi:ParB family transcriptional regulator, chromosome partitioning protein
MSDSAAKILLQGRAKPSMLIIDTGPAGEMAERIAAEPPAHQALRAPSSMPETPPLGTGAYQIGQTYEIPLVKIRENKLNARAYYASSEVTLMGESMALNGQEVPALGYLEDECVYLIDGQKRWKSATSAGISTLRVEIRTKPPSQSAAYLESRRINSERSLQTGLDDAVRFAYLLEQGIFTSQEQLAAAVGLDQSSVSRILGINAIPESIRAQMQNWAQLCEMRVACAISKIFKNVPLNLDEASQGDKGAIEAAQLKIAEAVLASIIGGDMSAKQVEALVSARLAPAKRNNRANIREFLYFGKKVTLKTLPSAGKLEFAVQGLSPEKVHELNSKIESVLKEGDEFEKVSKGEGA